MTEKNRADITPAEEKINMQQIMQLAKEAYAFLKRKWLIVVIFGTIGGAIGFSYAYFNKTIYTAKVTFALEEEKGGGGGLAGAIGLASSLGFDLGSGAGGAFSGANLIELMRSRRIVERSLLSPITVGKEVKTMAQYYIEFKELNKSWNEKNGLAGVRFPPNADRSSFSLLQDSILGVLYLHIAGPKGILSVAQRDKKISIISVEVRSENELFAKYLAESIVRETSDFYIDTKSKKSKANVTILQRQADSVRNELNSAIVGVAVANDNTFNINTAMMVPRSSGLKRQVDVQANTAILTQLVTNLELAKIALRKDTPLIQIIDTPILPLFKERPSKIISTAIGGIVAGIIIVLWLLVQFWIRKSSRKEQPE